MPDTSFSSFPVWRMHSRVLLRCNGFYDHHRVGALWPNAASVEIWFSKLIRIRSEFFLRESVVSFLVLELLLDI